MIPERTFASADEMLAHYRAVRARAGLDVRRPVVVRPAPPPPPEPPQEAPEPTDAVEEPPGAVEPEPADAPPLTVREIVARVAAKYDVTSADILGRDKSFRVVAARHAAIAAASRAYPKKPVRWLAAQFGRDSTTVHSSLQLSGLKPPRQKVGQAAAIGERHRRKLSDEQVQRAAALYSRRYSCRTIGEIFGVSDKTVNDALRRHGVQLRSPVAWRRS